jgi:large repetitive protein
VLTFNLGNILNPANGVATDDFVIIEIYARVQNVVENQNGDVRTNEVLVSWTEEDDPLSLTDSASITVVEPDLEILKSVSKTELTLGDEVIYTVTVRHTALSTADAHDLVIIDAIPPNMDYVPGSSSLPPSQVTHAAGDPETLAFDIPLLSLADHDITFTYRCVLEYDESLAEDPPVVQVNEAFLTYTSVAGDEPDERTGDDGIGGAVDDYADDASQEITPIIRSTIRAEKTVVDANGGELIGGDALIYTIVLTNTSGTSHDVVFTDAIPAWTTYVANSLSTDKVGATIDDSANPLVVYVGDMVENEVVTITFGVRIDARAPTGTVISNQGVVNSDDTTPYPSDDPDDPTSDTDPTDITVVKSLIVVGGEAMRPDKARVQLNWVLDMLSRAGAAS